MKRKTKHTNPLNNQTCKIMYSADGWFRKQKAKKNKKPFGTTWKLQFRWDELGQAHQLGKATLQNANWVVDSALVKQSKRFIYDILV